jgi:hypothetical protein
MFGCLSGLGLHVLLSSAPELLKPLRAGINVAKCYAELQ